MQCAGQAHIVAGRGGGFAYLLNESWSCCAVLSRISDCFSVRLLRARLRLSVSVILCQQLRHG